MGEAEVTKIFKNMDIDKNGKISFQEFYDWWRYGKLNNLKALLYTKMKAQKVKNKLKKFMDDKVGNINSNPASQEYSSSILNIQIGDDPIQSELCINVFSGKDS